MQGHMSKPITDKEAVEHAQMVEEPTVYRHTSSGTLRIAYPNGTVRKQLTYEEVNRLASYIGFTPTPDSSYLG